MNYSKTFKTETIKAKLDAGLDLGLNVRITEPHEQCLYHEVVRIDRSLNFPRNIDALAVLELALVTAEGREKGYRSGVGKIYTHNSFRGLNIAPILVRNSIDLFKENGDRFIECNTETIGAYFWQKMGWLATEHGVEFGETILDDSISFEGWCVLVNSLKRKPYEGQLDIFSKSEENVKAALSLLDEDDPSSIWRFIDSGITVKVYDFSTDGEREVNFAGLVLGGEKVNSVLNLDSNMQIDRFRSCVDLLEFDKPRFQEIWQEEHGRHIRNINADAVLEGFKPIGPSEL